MPTGDLGVEGDRRMQCETQGSGAYQAHQSPARSLTVGAQGQPYGESARSVSAVGTLVTLEAWNDNLEERANHLDVQPPYCEEARRQQDY
jgi:hypothetical protein